MNFKDTVKVNKKIMALIRSKYPDDFPAGYSTPDYTYYMRLERDVENAERSLSYSDKK